MGVDDHRLSAGVVHVDARAEHLDLVLDGLATGAGLLPGSAQPRRTVDLGDLGPRGLGKLHRQQPHGPPSDLQQPRCLHDDALVAALEGRPHWQTADVELLEALPVEHRMQLADVAQLGLFAAEVRFDLVERSLQDQRAEFAGALDEAGPGALGGRVTVGHRVAMLSPASRRFGGPEHEAFAAGSDEQAHTVRAACDQAFARLLAIRARRAAVDDLDAATPLYDAALAEFAPHDQQAVARGQRAGLALELGSPFEDNDLLLVDAAQAPLRETEVAMQRAGGVAGSDQVDPVRVRGRSLAASGRTPATARSARHAIRRRAR